MVENYIFKEKLIIFAILRKLPTSVKELLEPIVLWRKGDGVLLFLKAFSWETDLWVTLGDFALKTQNWEGKSVIN